jgi:hypothetical protein
MSLSQLPAGMPEFFDRKGKQIRFDIFARLAEKAEYVTVRAEFVRGYAVSTVWTGHNMSIFPAFPLIFETVIFAPSQVRVPYIVYGPERYASEAAALDGHDVALAWLEEHPDAAQSGTASPFYDALSAAVHRIEQIPG